MRLARLFTVIIIALVGSACTSPDPLFCDESTPCTDSARSFCDLGGEFMPDEGAAKTCIAPPFAGACNAASPCISGDACVDGTCPSCVADGECPNNAPTCGSDGQCFAGCREAQDCAGRMADICDDNGSCRGCESDSDCDGALCLGGGVCADAANLILVATDGADTDDCGTTPNPCASIERAIGKVTADRSTIYVRSGDYPRPLSISRRSVTIVGESGARITPALNTNSALFVLNGADVTLQNVEVAPTSRGNVISHGIRIEPFDGDMPTLRLSNVSVYGLSGNGIIAVSSRVEIQQSTIRGNESGGISLSGCEYSVTNSFVTDNGLGRANGSDFGGVFIDGAPGELAEFQFNTVANNLASSDSANARGIHCANQGTEVANTIVSGGDGGIGDVANCVSRYSLSASVLNGTNNVLAEPIFVNAAEGDFHSAESSPAVDAADPAGALAIDFDGEPRPSAGTAPDIGADEVQP